MLDFDLSTASLTGLDPLRMHVRALVDVLQADPSSTELLCAHARTCGRVAASLEEPVETIYELLRTTVRPTTADGERLLDFVTEEIYAAYWDD